jgi:heme-degrading monooxygenase HmoA
MALARVVTFDGVSKDRMAELKKEMEAGEAPEGFPSSELIVLHDPDAEKSLVVVVFDSDDDYKKGDEILSAMPAGDTPGQRTSVTKYDVAMRMKS